MKLGMQKVQTKIFLDLFFRDGFEYLEAEICRFFVATDLGHPVGPYSIGRNVGSAILRMT